MLEKIISFLNNSEGYLSGEEISRSLNISRAGIWKYIQELRKLGYDIVAVPHLGYKINSIPDKLFPFEIQNNLNTKNFGKKIYYHDTISSTMDEAFRLGVEGAPDGTVVCAESQTKGRGRLGRTWSSPKSKGIYLSIIVRPLLSPIEVPQLTLLSAVAVCEAIHTITGVQSLIKWPNDLLINQKKLAGILTELSADMDRVKFIVIGMGINVNTSGAKLPEEGTSLKVETGKTISRVLLTKAILESMEHWYLKFLNEGFKGVITRWKELSTTLGKHIAISDPGASIEGEAVDIDEDGGLLVRNDTGVVVKKMTGDVIQIR